MNDSTEQRVKDLGIALPPPPPALGAYVDSVQVGNLLYMSGVLPVEGGVPQFLGRIGAELSIEDGRRAARLAALNALARARKRLQSLDKVTRVVQLRVTLAATAEFRDHPKVADAASELLMEIFGADNLSTRMVAGVASLPAGACAVVELLLQVDTGV
jgi:enamine deaminase RidA (YjgF/YER057c/UK114 family)